MSNTDLDLADLAPFSPHLHVSFATNGNIFDLSGKIPFKVYVNVSRREPQLGQHFDVHKLPVDLLADGSVLDVSGAVERGVLLLTKVGSGSAEGQGDDQSKQVLPVDVSATAAGGLRSELPCFIRLKSGFKISAVDPQCVECLLSPSLSTRLEDDKIYMLEYPSETESEDWNGGITWWKLVSDPSTPPDLALPSDEPALKILRSPLPTFKAMSNPPRPPKIEYEIDIQPTRLDICYHELITITVKFRLQEATRYTVMSIGSDTNPGPRINALGTSNLGSSNFDLVDIATGDILSIAPINDNVPFDLTLSQRPIRKHQLRELEPGVTYTGKSKITPRGFRDMLVSFQSFFRFQDVENYRNRRLGVKLRPVQTFWSDKGIDELFEHDEVIRPEQWYIPLTIESSAVAEFLIED